MIRPTHCQRGHEFTDENTIRRTNGRRACRTCATEAARLRRLPGAEEREARRVAALEANHARQRTKMLADLENLAFLAETGESLEIAAARLGRTPRGVERLLQDHEMHDVYRQLARQSVARVTQGVLHSTV